VTYIAPVTPGQTTPRTQPRAAGQATRSAIRAAATRLFAEHGFNQVSVRTIAAAAEVDPALVIRHFGSKESLFLQTLDPMAGGLAEVMAGPLETLGPRLVEHFLGQAGTHLRQNFVALIHPSDRPHVRDELIRSTGLVFVQPIATRLTGDRPELRAALVAAQVGGLLNSLFLAEDPVIAAAVEEDVVELYGGAIQHLLTP
jgi:AcrR family transcriptional regulator